MPFRATQVMQKDALDIAIRLAAQEKSILNNWIVALGGEISGIDAVEWLVNLNNVTSRLSAASAVPGIAEYAQAQFDDPTYDIAAEFSTMLNALKAVETWLKVNIPANAVSIVNGELTGATYGTGVTAPLLALVQSAEATID